MDEQRSQAYQNLIYQLLYCKEGDESRILQENQELVDQQLVQQMIEVEQHLGNSGGKKNAEKLMNIAQQLADVVEFQENETIETLNPSQNSLDFLQELLARVDYDPNPQLIYPFLAQNLDKLNDNLIQLLEECAKNTLPSASIEDSKRIVSVISQFSNLIQSFPLGNIATNMEIAITGYKIALNIFTFKVFPQEWATLQNNLAIAYSERIRGNKAENLEQAILAYKEALKVRTYKEHPEDWATTLNNLAIAYRNRIKGDKAENLEQALLTYTEALKVRTYEDNPEDWADTHNNLGNAYLYRIRGDKANNLEKAISAYTEALRVYHFDTLPEKWANTQNNLAIAYRNRIRGDKAENLEQAIFAYIEALRVYTFETFPEEWAMTHNNLASAYRDRIKGDKANNLERAITFYTKTLEICTFEKFPQNWAMTQLNMAIAYRHRITGDKANNLTMAIKLYQNALKIYTKEKEPLNCLQTARNLAILHDSQQQWQLATEAYHTAIEAVENARLEALNPQSRQEVLSNAIDVFHSIVQAYLNLNQPEKALEYIERSKGRNLVELMTQKGLTPQNMSQEIIDQLAQLKQQVFNEQIRLQHQSINQNLMRSDNLTPYVQDHSYFQQYQQQLDTFIAEKITPYDPTFSLTQKVKPIPFEDIKSLTDDSTCLLQWYITGEKILAFIVSANETVKVWQSSEEDRNQLFDTLNNYLQLYDSNEGKQEWINQVPNLLQTFANILHINEIISLIPDTCQRL